MKNRQGFTLIELLIVIGIIAILASGVIVAINPGQQFEQARNSTRWQHMNTIANVVYSYAVEDQGNLPTCDDNEATGTPTPLTDGDGTARDISECTSELAPTYINELPKDPSAGGVDHGTCYGTEADCTGYTISSNGTTITLESVETPEADEVTLTK